LALFTREAVRHSRLSGRGGPARWSPTAVAAPGHAGTVTVSNTTSVAIRTRYRLVTALRLDPAAARRVLKVQVGRLRASGKTVLMALRNSGNTVMPITGSVRITGGAGTVRTTLAEARILPGATVDVSLRSGKLLAGRYVADMTLRQGGRSVATAKRAFRVR
jgi:hypothetical protein